MHTTTLICVCYKNKPANVDTLTHNYYYNAFAGVRCGGNKNGALHNWSNASHKPWGGMSLERNMLAADTCCRSLSLSPSKIQGWIPENLLERATRSPSKTFVGCRCAYDNPQYTKDKFTLCSGEACTCSKLYMIYSEEPYRTLLLLPCMTTLLENLTSEHHTRKDMCCPGTANVRGMTATKTSTHKAPAQTMRDPFNFRSALATFHSPNTPTLRLTH